MMSALLTVVAAVVTCYVCERYYFPRDYLLRDRLLWLGFGRFRWFRRWYGGVWSRCGYAIEHLCLMPRCHCRDGIMPVGWRPELHRHSLGCEREDYRPTPPVRVEMGPYR